MSGKMLESLSFSLDVLLLTFLASTRRAPEVSDLEVAGFVGGALIFAEEGANRERHEQSVNEGDNNWARLTWKSTRRIAFGTSTVLPITDT